MENTHHVHFAGGERKKEKSRITWPCIENLRWADLTWGFWNEMEWIVWLCAWLLGVYLYRYRYGCLPSCLPAWLLAFLGDLVCMVGGDGLTEGGNPYVAYFVLYRRGGLAVLGICSEGLRVSGVLGVFFYLHLSLRIGIWEFAFLW